MKNNNLKNAVKCLRKAFEHNSKAHFYRDYINDNYGYEDVSDEVYQRDKYYYLKQKYINKAI